MKTEVYSWRVSPELKSDLEREARRRNISLAAALDLAVQQWLKLQQCDEDDLARQQKLHSAAAKCLGTLAGGNPRRAETAREAVRESLRRRYGR